MQIKLAWALAHSDATVPLAKSHATVALAATMEEVVTVQPTVIFVFMALVGPLVLRHATSVLKAILSTRQRAIVWCREGYKKKYIMVWEVPCKSS